MASGGADENELNDSFLVRFLFSHPDLFFIFSSERDQWLSSAMNLS
jgi:hypothetical protein